MDSAGGVGGEEILAIFAPKRLFVHAAWDGWRLQLAGWVARMLTAITKRSWSLLKDCNHRFLAAWEGWRLQLAGWVARMLTGITKRSWALLKDCNHRGRRISEVEKLDG